MNRWTVRTTGRAAAVAATLAATVAGLGIRAVEAQGTLCGFQLGFANVRALIPAVVGDCVENERFNLANGNAEQRTTGGLLVWRKADNWTAFTDGYRTWLNGPGGVQDRLNDGPLFSWEQQAGNLVTADNTNSAAGGDATALGNVSTNANTNANQNTVNPSISIQNNPTIVVQLPPGTSLPAGGTAAGIPTAPPASVAPASPPTASGVAGATGAPRALPASSPGTVLLSDNFDDPVKGILRQASPAPQSFLEGYDGGEYFVRLVGAGSLNAVAPLPGVYGDSSIVLDARVIGGYGRFALIRCRYTADQYGILGMYQLSVDMDTAMVRIERFDSGRPTTLADWQAAVAIKKGSSNRIELGCAGSTISAAINGTTVLSVQDATYRTGNLLIGVGSLSGQPAEARFDNLIVTQR